MCRKAPIAIYWGSMLVAVGGRSWCRSHQGRAEGGVLVPEAAAVAKW